MSTNLHDIIKQFVEYTNTRHLIDRIKSSPDVNDQDFMVFNIGQKRQETSNIDTAISTSPNADISPIGGDRVTIICRQSGSDKAKAALPRGANAVEYRYLINDNTTFQYEDQALTTGVSTRSRLTIDLGVENRARFLHISFRWNNLKHQEKAGPWADFQNLVIT